MNNHCVTCKHWAPPDAGTKPMGTCMTSSPGLLGFSPTSGERLMEATCDEDRGCLLTAPNFGCVHWEAKP